MATIAGAPPLKGASRGRSRFFANAAIAMAACIVLSFSLSYFGPLLSGSGGFIMLRHVHGAVFFAWVALYVTQANLVAGGRVRLHRELGVATVAVSAAMVPLGFWMAVRDITEQLEKGAERPFEVAAYNFFDLSLFAIAMAGATHCAGRRNDWHRRLVYLAAICLLGPAVSRWLPYVPNTVPYPLYDALPNLAADLFLIPLAWHDRRTLGRLHPMTLGAVVLLLPWNLVEPLVGRSAAWGRFAPHLFGFA
jgi:hypothetical protein